MKPKERFLKALRMEAIDRPPVGAVATGITVGMMEKVGIYWPEAHKDPEKKEEIVSLGGGRDTSGNKDNDIVGGFGDEKVRPMSEIKKKRGRQKKG